MSSEEAAGCGCLAMVALLVAAIPILLNSCGVRDEYNSDGTLKARSYYGSITGTLQERWEYDSYGGHLTAIKKYRHNRLLTRSCYYSPDGVLSGVERGGRAVHLKEQGRDIAQLPAFLKYWIRCTGIEAPAIAK